MTSQVGNGARRTERVMFFWFLVAVAAVVGLTLLGAFIARGEDGYSDDGPMGPWADH